MQRRLALGALLALVAGSMLGLPYLVHRFEFRDLAQSSDSASKAYQLHEQGFGAEIVAEFEFSGEGLPSLSQIRDWVQTERLSNSGVKSLLGPWQLGRFVPDGKSLNFVSPSSVGELGPDLGAFFGATPEADSVRFFVGFWNDSERPFRAEDLRRFENFLRKQAPNLSLEVRGPAAFAAASQEHMLHDERLNLLVLIVIPFLAFLLWGSWRLGFLLLGTLALSSGTVLGLMGWFGAPLDAVSSILLIVIAFASIEDFVFVVHSARRSGRIDDAAFSRVRLPCLLTSITTAEGFLALLTSDLSMIGRFGLWVAVGAIVEWAIVFGVLPPLFRAFPRLGELPSRSLSPISQWLIPKKLAWILLALPFLALVLAPPLRAHVDPFELFSKDHPLRVDAEKHRATEKVLAVSRADLSLDEWKQSLEEMKVQPGVQYVVSSESVLGLWISEVDAQDQGLVAWLRRQWVGSGIADRFESESGLHRAYAEVRSGDLESLKLWAESQSRLQLTNDYWVYNEFAANVIQTLKDSTWLALFLVGALISVMAVVMRQWRAIPRLLLCAVWGPVSMLALCRWLEIPVTVNLAPFAAVLMGLSGDNAIQFLYFSRKEAGFLAASQNWGRASVEVSVFMFVLAAIPMFSAFAPATTLALFLMGGVLLALIGELYIFKSLETDS